MFRIGGLGLMEILVILLLLALLFGGKRLGGLFARAGESAREVLDKVKWVYSSLAGSEEEEVRSEEKVGREMAAKFLEQHAADGDMTVQQQVEEAGARLAQASGNPHRTFTFRVVRGETINAVALPGGNVFVFRPLMDLLRGDDNQLAFVLAHEMGHVIHRHAAEKFQLGTVLNATRLAGALRQVIDTGYSREHEREADLKAVEIMRAAKFDPRGAAMALERMQTASRHGQDSGGFLSTHPETADRIAYIREAIAG